MLHTIKIQEETRDKLRELKAPGQSYTGFISQLIERWKETGGHANGKTGSQERLSGGGKDHSNK